MSSFMSGPPGPFRRSFWRSPIRGPWLTSIFGLALLAGIPVLFVTGLLSYAAYNPDLSPINDETAGKGLLGFYLFSWPTRMVGSESRSVTGSSAVRLVPRPGSE